MNPQVPTLVGPANPVDTLTTFVAIGYADLLVALKVMLREGISVEKNGYHLYRRGKKESHDFIVLHYPPGPGFTPDVDETFPDIDEAIDRYLSLLNRS